MAEQPTGKPSPQEVEKMIRDYQMVQEQMRNFQIQVEQLQMQSNELQTAKEEVGKATGKVYVAIGGVIVETSKETALKNIDEKSETSTVRLQSANKQLNELRAREKQLREKITQMSSSLQ
ncbi:MAG: prefoldin subunit [Candidatus Micrarchaeota archaeon]|nr:prefoldin subunit [Candidatus Micrarchaeota archaeon]